jgi:nitrate reductase (cytochrome)
MPKAYIEMNAADAAAAGIRSGDKVIVESRRGSIQCVAWIEGRGKPPRGTVFVPFFDETIMINDLTLDAIDPFSKQPDYKKSAVRIRKV